MTVAGVKVFERVEEYEDVTGFLERAKSSTGTAAAIIARPPEEDRPTDNAASSAFRLLVEIAVRFEAKRNVGEDDADAAAGLRRYTTLIRDALRGDRSRGGKTKLIEWRGQVLDGTDLNQTPRLEAKKPNQAFHVAVVPVACGWESPVS